MYWKDAFKHCLFIGFRAFIIQDDGSLKDEMFFVPGGVDIEKPKLYTGKYGGYFTPSQYEANKAARKNGASLEDGHGGSIVGEADTEEADGGDPKDSDSGAAHQQQEAHQVRDIASSSTESMDDEEEAEDNRRFSRRQSTPKVYAESVNGDDSSSGSGEDGAMIYGDTFDGSVATLLSISATEDVATNSETEKMEDVRLSSRGRRRRSARSESISAVTARTTRLRQTDIHGGGGGGGAGSGDDIPPLQHHHDHNITAVAVAIPSPPFSCDDEGKSETSVKDTESQLARLVLAPASISRDHP
jgi:hypothetical protein